MQEFDKIQYVVRGRRLSTTDPKREFDQLGTYSLARTAQKIVDGVMEGPIPMLSGDGVR